MWPLLAMMALAVAKNNAQQQQEKSARKREAAFARTAPFGGMQPARVATPDYAGTLLSHALTGGMLEQNLPGSPDEKETGTPGDLTKPPGNQTSPWLDMTGSGVTKEDTAKDIAPTSQSPLVSNQAAPGDFYYHDAITNGPRPDVPVTVDPNDPLLNGAQAAAPSLNTVQGPAMPPNYYPDYGQHFRGPPTPEEQAARAKVSAWHNIPTFTNTGRGY